jgi:hypothetical protein
MLLYLLVMVLFLVHLCFPFMVGNWGVSAPGSVFAFDCSLTCNLFLSLSTIRLVVVKISHFRFSADDVESVLNLI